ncbi:hypothetical protein P4255_16480 [Bacillus wiedmannii]|uniref:hypothetical protein n=1 Tax=Bacillus wiedmannii TaxID=1890302 RepID=UPI002E233790|nr:hypothetical protein [Bacillus wiedmannii]
MNAKSVVGEASMIAAIAAVIVKKGSHSEWVGSGKNNLTMLFNRLQLNFWLYRYD